jgi:hypothetical protein
LVLQESCVLKFAVYTAQTGVFMKKLLILAVLVSLVCLTFVGCGAESPSSVTKNFFAAVEKNDQKALEACSTPETVTFIAMFGEKASNSVKENGKITETSETIDGDTAVVKVTFENGETNDVKLIKVDKKWKVHMSMEK